MLLFARVDALGVAWLRNASRGADLRRLAPPVARVRAVDRDGKRTLIAWGAVLAAMNCCFYLAIDLLPLGTVAAIEFLPVIALAAAGARTPRNASALLLAVAGVYLLTDVRLAGEPLGVALAFANAVLFALYIVLAHRVSRLERALGRRRAGRVDSDRRRRRHAAGGLGGRCRRSATPWRCSRAWGWACPRR